MRKGSTSPSRNNSSVTEFTLKQGKMPEDCNMYQYKLSVSLKTIKYKQIKYHKDLEGKASSIEEKADEMDDKTITNM